MAVSDPANAGSSASSASASGPNPRLSVRGAIAERRPRGGRALVPFLTAGYPDWEICSYSYVFSACIRRDLPWSRCCASERCWPWCSATGGTFGRRRTAARGSSRGGERERTGRPGTSCCFSWRAGWLGRTRRCTFWVLWLPSSSDGRRLPCFCASCAGSVGRERVGGAERIPWFSGSVPGTAGGCVSPWLCTGRVVRAQLRPAPPCIWVHPHIEGWSLPTFSATRRCQEKRGSPFRASVPPARRLGDSPRRLQSASPIPARSVPARLAGSASRHTALPWIPPDGA
jgi:hypothetical protein